MRLPLFPALLLALCPGLWLPGCATTSTVWPQDDIGTFEMKDPSLDRRLLVASRTSDFKDEVVRRIQEDLRDRPVYVKFIGVDNLRREKASDYGAVVIISTCMAWELDREVLRFLKQNPEQGNLILLTTSGDGGWLPDGEGRRYDALSTASEMDDTEDIADAILLRVHVLLDLS